MRRFIKNHDPDQMRDDLICQLKQETNGIENGTLTEKPLSKIRLSQKNKLLSMLKRMPEPTQREKIWRKSRVDGFDVSRFKFNPKLKNTQHSEFRQKNTICPHDGFSGSYIVNPDKNIIQLSNELSRKGVIFSDFGTAEKKFPKILETVMGKIVRSTNNKFTLRTLADPQCGLVLYVPNGVKIAEPFFTDFKWNGSSNLFTCYCVIYLEENSSATVIQQYYGCESKGRENALIRVAEIMVGLNATLNYSEMNSFNDSWWSFTDEYSIVRKGGRINWTVYNDGGYYTKTFLGVELTGKKANAKVTGIVIPGGNTQIDFDTYQKHTAPFTTSDLFFKNAMADTARSNWSGMIKVGKKAEKADGYQAHQNLMLCGKPHVESNPGLEIHTNDVKCSHGVTVGEIDTEQVFYLKSRGISESEARQLIAKGFLESGLIRVGDEVSRKVIGKRIIHNLSSLRC